MSKKEDSRRELACIRWLSAMQHIAERVHQERCELIKKIMKLQDFIKSEKYGELDGEHKFLLDFQLRTMQSYEFVLLRRWALLSEGI